MRRIGVILALLLVLPAWPALASTESAGALRPYRVHVPAGLTEPSALVVYLHGCNQTAEDAEVGTRWSEVADEHGFVVAYPEQVPEANGARCWNWFLPEHQQRGAGEPAILHDIVQRVIAAHPIDASRVYVAGASAGADMATILAATYPDVFAAVAPFAGCAYATCADVTGALAREAMGDLAGPVPAFVVQGTADPLNNAAMGETAVQQWVGTNGVSPVPTSSEDHGDATPGTPASGDTCVRNAQFPCLAGATGWEAYPYTVHHHADTDGCSLVDAVYVHGLSHDYPGGNPEGSFTDPAGPDVSRLTWSFFARHRVGAPCASA